MAYRTVGDVIAQVRTLLQDEDASGYRYTDATLIQALNSALLDTRRIRPDIFRKRLDDVPQYSTSDMAAGLYYEPMYVPALVYYVTGLAQLRDAEEATDARATQLLQAFGQKMASVP